MLIHRGWKGFFFGCFITSLLWILILNKTRDGTSNKLKIVEVDSGILNKQRNDITFDLYDWKTKEFDFIGLVRNEEDIFKHEDGFKKHAFNVLISERIGYQRGVPFTGDAKCFDKLTSYQVTKKASVLICFHNEDWPTLLRTVYSVVERSPPSLLHEIILVDDFSDHTRLIEKLPLYLKSNLPIVKYYRTLIRHGLIRARMKAASLATGDVLVFLDSHCEVNKYWIEPLLSRIEESRKNVVCPVIDMISSSTFVYQASPLVRGGFNWGMHFSWEQIPKNLIRDQSEPYSSPTMAGGLFAMERQYFLELGEYDAGMEIWGGENLEMSFRIWMCGGRIEIIPCSRVGHVFRSRRPYSDISDSSSVNAVRVANVWLDDYKKHFFDLRPDLKYVETNVTLRVELRKRLQCKTFKWYLEEVYPEMEIPNERPGLPYEKQEYKESSIWQTGKLFNVGSKQCLNAQDDTLRKKPLIVVHPCEQTSSKTWTLNSDSELQVNRKFCLEASLLEPFSSRKIRAVKCHGDKEGQDWKFSMDTKQLYNPANGMCLADESNIVRLSICDRTSASQKWMFV